VPEDELPYPIRPLDCDKSIKGTPHLARVVDCDVVPTREVEQSILRRRPIVAAEVPHTDPGLVTMFPQSFASLHPLQQLVRHSRSVADTAMKVDRARTLTSTEPAEHRARAMIDESLVADRSTTASLGSTCRGA
jgi:hypothetical protein